MLFAVHARDRDKGLDIRLANRDAHIAHLQSIGDRLKFAGPLLDDEGAMCGSLLILDAESRDELQTWLDSDPYQLAGLFSTVTVTGIKPLLGSMAGAL